MVNLYNTESYFPKFSQKFSILISVCAQGHIINLRP